MLIQSLLMWECGLKQRTAFGTRLDGGVTPYVGVWIETLMRFARPARKTSHSLCGSVD